MFVCICRYGKVFKSHIFGSPTIVSTDAEVSRFILQSDAKSFVPCYPKSLTELMGKSSILLINGNLQRRIHGLIGSFFKSPHIKAQITKDMQKYVQESMNNWKHDTSIYIQDEAKNVSAFLIFICGVFCGFVCLSYIPVFESYHLSHDLLVQVYKILR